MRYTVEMASFSTKFKENRYRRSSNIKVLLPSDIWEAVMLVLLIGRIYELHRCDGLRCHVDTEFHTDWFRHSKVSRQGYT
jgi:hypothetical protein